MEKNEIKKDLYKSKNMAKFSHYESGKLFYTVELTDGLYLFPIVTVEEKECKIIGHTPDGEDDLFKNTFKYAKLSDDLGSTTFANEIRGSELIRWIDKAIDSNQFIKIA